MGSKAFFPGELVHTNELMVLLGNNYFAEKSAKQAVELVDRRLEGVWRGLYASRAVASYAHLLLRV